VEYKPPQNGQGRDSGSPSNSGTGTLSAIRRIGLEVEVRGWGYRAERVCHRIARTRLRELLLNRGYRDAVGSHANCPDVKSARVEYNPQWTAGTAVSHMRAEIHGLSHIHAQRYRVIIVGKLAGLSGLAGLAGLELAELAELAELSDWRLELGVRIRTSLGIRSSAEV